MHGGELRLGRESLGIVAQQGEIAQPGLDALGNRDLSGHAAKDDLGGGVNPVAGQGVDDVVPRPGLDLIERFGGSGRPLPGSMGTIERSASERRGMARESLHPLALNRENPPANALKSLRPTRNAGALRPTRATSEILHVSERKLTRARESTTDFLSTRPPPL